MDIDPASFDDGLSDDMFEKIIALIRIAVPYTGMIISTRESPSSNDAGSMSMAGFTRKKTSASLLDIISMWTIINIVCYLVHTW